MSKKFYRIPEFVEMDDRPNILNWRNDYLQFKQKYYVELNDIEIGDKTCELIMLYIYKLKQKSYFVKAIIFTNDIIAMDNFKFFHSSSININFILNNLLKTIYGVDNE